MERGYSDQSLYVNVGTGKMEVRPVAPETRETFIGGKGYGLRMLWDAVTPNTKWQDPENEIVISGGPCSGITQYSGSGKSIVVAISPQTEKIIDSNVGGHFGPHLKIAGFDALEVQGNSDKDVIIYINGVDHVVEIFETPQELNYDSHLLGEELLDMFADSEKDKINVSVVASGKAAEHSLIGMLNFTFWDMKRGKVRLKQAGRGGLGTLMR
ncbi:MAG: aldehyde:ferredoxin oxidoreductase, partial [Bacteroidetes bacterium HGW-Bacteroidetes-14]